ncbi:hypothetical protein HBI51_239530 [Parastagonospora nodorum]|nr:hypothetical protein HBI51_239530 [Parastagonospora nodorum]
MDPWLFECKIDAEPIHRYCKGGYHPVHLEDILNNGTYRILHKLGWGGYSTVWAARNLKTNNNVAIKIAVSERCCQSREVTVLRAVAAAQSERSNCHHLMTMQDHFQLDGPNGTHDCLVLEILGPSVGDVLDKYFCNERLPAKLAKRIAKQTLLGLCSLHERGIAHGDLYIRNVAFTVPSLHALTEEELVQKLGKPGTGQIQRKDGIPLDHGMPQYLVRPTSYPPDLKSSTTNIIKLIDYGQSFQRHDTPNDFNTPLPVRAPEIIFKDTVDYRMDLWSMGCMLFELVVGQPVFDSIMISPPMLVRQMLETVNEDLPERWREKWRVMDTDPPDEEPGICLQDWLEEMYFDGERKEEFSREDIVRVGALIRSMLRLEPSMRAEARDVLKDSWFDEE